MLNIIFSEWFTIVSISFVLFVTTRPVYRERYGWSSWCVRVSWDQRRFVNWRIADSRNSELSSKTRLNRTENSRVQTGFRKYRNVSKMTNNPLEYFESYRWKNIIFLPTDVARSTKSQKYECPPSVPKIPFTGRFSRTHNCGRLLTFINGRWQYLSVSRETGFKRYHWRRVRLWSALDGGSVRSRTVYTTTANGRVPIRHVVGRLCQKKPLEILWTIPAITRSGPYDTVGFSAVGSRNSDGPAPSSRSRPAEFTSCMIGNGMSSFVGTLTAQT